MAQRAGGIGDDTMCIYMITETDGNGKKTMWHLESKQKLTDQECDIFRTCLKDAKSTVAMSNFQYNFQDILQDALYRFFGYTNRRLDFTDVQDLSEPIGVS